jgi:hypothetical protein
MEIISLYYIVLRTSQQYNQHFLYNAIHRIRRLIIFQIQTLTYSTRILGLLKHAFSLCGETHDAFQSIRVCVLFLLHY